MILSFDLWIESLCFEKGACFPAVSTWRIHGCLYLVFGLSCHNKFVFS